MNKSYRSFSRVHSQNAPAVLSAAVAICVLAELLQKIMMNIHGQILRKGLQQRFLSLYQRLISVYCCR